MYCFTTICAGAAIDMQILDDLFGYFIAASALVGETDTAMVAEVSAKRARLVPWQIGSGGALQEWAEDHAQGEDEHRHNSHLYGLYPGLVLANDLTPELTAAIKKTLEQRGNGGKGFSRAWKMALWARLGDGDRANAIFKPYLVEQATKSMFAKCGKTPQVDGCTATSTSFLDHLSGISQLNTTRHTPPCDVLYLVPVRIGCGRRL